jgi:hypothetical protein
VDPGQSAVTLPGPGPVLYHDRQFSFQTVDEMLVSLFESDYRIALRVDVGWRGPCSFSPYRYLCDGLDHLVLLSIRRMSCLGLARICEMDADVDR